MSKISKEGYDQIQVIKNALNAMYDKLDTNVYTKNGTKYESKNVFSEVKQRHVWAAVRTIDSKES